MRVNLYAANVADVEFNYNCLTGLVHHKVLKQQSQQGAGVELVMKSGFSNELVYLRQQQAPIQLYQAHEVNAVVSKTRLDYLMYSAGVHLQNPFSEIKGYVGLMGGTTLVTTRVSAVDASVRYQPAWGARVACSYWLTHIVGLRLESFVLMSHQPLYVQSMPTIQQMFIYTSVHQVSFALGLTIKLGAH